MANKIEIDIEVNGKMTKATVDVKKLRGQMEGLDDVQEKTKKSGDKFQKGLKGLGDQSANASKNFSKFSAGMGGFVGVYASLAAQLFAVSAAFQFLKRAGDLQTLQAGQEAYASATGIGLRTLTNDIIAATDATVTFQDAAQAAAIGTAAGLSSDQLTRLGTAAKDASIILGRDVTDSFNRLVRGVTKAEPELLDELGIILRLKDATAAYAAELGVDADQLTAFQRSQAVANDVLTQTEQKYSKILAVTGGSANAYSQLGKAFDDIVIKLSALADFLVGPIAKVLTETPQLAIAAFGLLASGPLSALGISFKDVAKNARIGAEAAKANYSEMSLAAKRATTDAATLKVQLMDLAKQQKLNAANKSPVLQRLTTGTMTGTDTANLKKALKAAEANYNKHGIIVKGIFKDLHISTVREINTMFAQYELAEQKKLSATGVYVAKAKAMYAGLAAAIKRIGAALATGLNFALRWLGWVGLAVTAYQILADVLGFNTEKVDKEADAYQRSREKLQELNKELKNFAEIQTILAEGNRGTVQGFGNVASALGQRNAKEAVDDLKLYSETLKRREEVEEDFEKRLRKRMKNIQRHYASKGGKYNFDVESASLETLEKNMGALKKSIVREDLGLSDAQKGAEDYFTEILGGLDGIEKGSGMSFKSFRNFRAAVESGDPKKLLETRDAALELGEAIRSGERAAKDAAMAVQGFANSLAPKNQAETTLDAIQARLDVIDKMAGDSPTYTLDVAEPRNITKAKELSDLFGFEVPPITVPITYQGLDPKIVKEQKKLIQQAAVINKINESRTEAQLRSLNLQKEMTQSTLNMTAAEQALFTLKNKSLSLTDQRQAKEDEIKAIVAAAVEFQDGKLTPAQIRQIRLLGAQVGLLTQQKVLNDEILGQKEKTLGLENALIAMSNFSKIKQNEKMLLDMTEKRLQAEKQVLEMRLKIAKGQSAERIAAAGVNNLFANTERMQAQENLRLAKQEVELKKPMIKAEYDNKLIAIDLEYDLLEAKRVQTAMELKKLAIELKLTDKPGSEQADALASKLMRGNYEGARNAAKDAALATREASEYGLGKMVRDAQRALQSTEAMNQVLRTAADAFRSAMNDAVNAIFDSLSDKTMDLNEKLKEIARNFLQAIQQAVTDKLIISPILEALGLGELGASPSNPMYVQAVGPGLGGGAAASGAIPGLPSIFGSGELGSSEANPMYVKDICGCPEGKPGAGLLDKIMKKEPPKDPLATGDYSSESIDDMINDIAGDAGPFKKLFNTFTDKLGTIFNFDSPFLKGIGNIFGSFKNGLGSIFGNIMGSFGDLFGSIGNLFGGGAGAGGGLLSGLASMIPGIGPILGGALSIFGFKNGGIMNNGSKVSGYATGGIADGPNSGHLAMLHGREAVVPLPNGNSIPVQMNGNGGMQNNNVTVNVSTDGQVQSSSNGAMGENLGQVIAAAVQKELHNQKRAGGILNKHGAA
jgi:hypothetical protein